MGNSSAGRKSRRQASWQRCHSPNGKKDMRVFKSSNGKFGSVAELEAHRISKEKEVPRKEKSFAQLCKGS